GGAGFGFGGVGAGGVGFETGGVGGGPSCTTVGVGGVAVCVDNGRPMVIAPMAMPTIATAAIDTGSSHCGLGARSGTGAGAAVFVADPGCRLRITAVLAKRVSSSAAWLCEACSALRMYCSSRASSPAVA